MTITKMNKDDDEDDDEDDDKDDDRDDDKDDGKDNDNDSAQAGVSLSCVEAGQRHRGRPLMLRQAGDVEAGR